ncbi:hypothetical protein Poly41_58110 [Novipirellula artificiosorum]|uniref:N-sulphoglucosamine sulphohydrolase C-terminal domain-containing protein n=1 Tax=Novipirellula artificiosorum TaxID=2528016 RepID=A0A5C6D894_9BACT|nr:hypothetical protein Poly41_58110 [Novipirellula artificiosorum]
MKHHYNPAHFGIRTKQWKLIFFYGVDEKPGKGAAPTPPAWELYDVKSDPLEMNNLYGDPQYTDIAAQLKEQLKATRAEVKDSDADYAHVAGIISRHWEGGEEEAIRLSHKAARNLINNKRQKGETE